MEGKDALGVTVCTWLSIGTAQVYTVMIACHNIRVFEASQLPPPPGAAPLT